MSEKKRFKQNRSFKKGLDEADDEMPMRSFGKDRRDRKPYDRKPYERDGERKGGERRGFRRGQDDDRPDGRKPFRQAQRKDFRNHDSDTASMKMMIIHWQSVV